MIPLLSDRELELLALSIYAILHDDRVECGPETRRELWRLAFRLGLRTRLVAHINGGLDGLAVAMLAKGGDQ
jgi:hypothetical protein